MRRKSDKAGGNHQQDTTSLFLHHLTDGRVVTDDAIITDVHGWYEKKRHFEAKRSKARMGRLVKSDLVPLWGASVGDHED